VLRKGREPVLLTPKAFDVLLLMVQNAGKTVSKDQLMESVWPNSFVEESNLTQTIFMVRRALDETSDRRYIMTVQDMVTDSLFRLPRSQVSGLKRTCLSSLPR